MLIPFKSFITTYINQLFVDIEEANCSAQLLLVLKYGYSSYQLTIIVQKGP